MEGKKPESKEDKKAVLERQDTLAGIEDLPKQPPPSTDEPSTSTGISASNTMPLTSHMAVYVSPDSSDSANFKKDESVVVTQPVPMAGKKTKPMLERDLTLSESDSYIGCDFYCCGFKRYNRRGDDAREEGSN